MSWRRVPPVYSPVGAQSLGAGVVSAIGAGAAARAHVRERIEALYRGRAVLTDSGTSALIMAIRAAMPRGGSIALPAYACIDLVAAAVYAGVRVRLYDQNPATLEPDPDSIRTALERGAAAVVVAPLFGYPVAMAEIVQLAATHGATVIEDAAQSAGAQIDGRRSGSFGELAVLSFGRGKGTTGGGGGALVVHADRFTEAVSFEERGLTPQARSTKQLVALGAQWLLARPALYALPASLPFLRLGEMVYHPAHAPGAMSGASASVLRVALRMEHRELEIRRSRASRLEDAARRGARFRPVEAAPRSLPGYLRVAMLARSEQEHGSESLGIVRTYPITLDEHEVTRTILEPGETAGPGARELRNRLFTAPVHSRLGEADMRRIESLLASAGTR